MKTTSRNQFEIVFVLIVGILVGMSAGYFLGAVEADNRVHAFEASSK